MNAFPSWIRSPRKSRGGEFSFTDSIGFVSVWSRKSVKKIGLYAAGGWFRIECLRRVLLILQQLPGQTPDFLVDSKRWREP